MGWVTCDNCGRSFNDKSLKGMAEVDRQNAEGILDTMGLGFAARAIKGKHFCCDSCKREYEAAHGGKTGGSSSSGGSGSAGSGTSAAEEKRIEREENEHFRSVLTGLTFSGDAASIGSDMDQVYTLWMQERKTADKDTRKLIDDKIEYGMMALKKADPMKAEFYEKKITEQKAKDKKMKKIKIIGITVGVVVVLLFLIGYSAQQ